MQLPFAPVEGFLVLGEISFFLRISSPFELCLAGWGVYF